MKIKAVDFATYIVSDLKEAVDFYQKTLGLKLTSQGDEWAEFEAGGTAIVLGSWGFKKSGSVRGNGLAFAVDDVGKTLEELKKKGVKIGAEAWETPVCFGGSIEDPDGNAIYFHKRKDGTAG